MVVMVVISVAIVGVFGLVQSGLRLTTLTENRITALNLAREGIEAVSNIRDSNWLKYANDKDICWMTADYDGGCIANVGTFYTTGVFTLFRRFVVPGGVAYEYDFGDRRIATEHPIDNPAHNQWILQRIVSDIDVEGTDISRDPYTVLFDDRGLPYQIASTASPAGVPFVGLPTQLCTRGKGSTGEEDRTADCRSIFHRAITLEFATDTQNFGVAECYDYLTNLARCVRVRSIVQWHDSTRRSAEPYELVLEKVLTNWADGF